MNLILKNYNTNIKPERFNEGNTTIFKWDVENPTITKTEEKYPYWFNPYPYVVITSFKSWEEVKKFNSEIVVQNETRIIN